ncbi:helix-turn-helix domain-containing protein [Aurantiacibacter zhengii]|uniref:helix-turn-helix domain-containing protein n=1 Tax=Aurantiacibacter zhengii TaxID=2307003 RepID=UPI0013149090|nr:helix-turn-helix domain-containing protein [Aurantiacibacter zhengii]
MEAEQFYKQLGSILAERRRAKGLTQTQLADRIGVPRTRLANVETGRQSVHVHQLVEIANALGAHSIEALLPANFWVPQNATQSSKVETTGSRLSVRQQKQVADIFDSLGED